MGQNQENLWIYVQILWTTKIFFSSLILLPFFFFFFAIQYDQNDGLGLKSQTVKFNVYSDGYI